MRIARTYELTNEELKMIILDYLDNQGENGLIDDDKAEFYTITNNLTDEVMSTQVVVMERDDENK